MKPHTKVLLIIFFISIGFVFFYLVEKRTDSPFEIEYTSSWRLKLLGFKEKTGHGEWREDTYTKKYDDATVVFGSTNSSHSKKVILHPNKKPFNVVQAIKDQLLKNHYYIIDSTKKSITIIKNNDSSFYTYYYNDSIINMFTMPNLKHYHEPHR